MSNFKTFSIGCPALTIYIVYMKVYCVSLMVVTMYMFESSVQQAEPNVIAPHSCNNYNMQAKKQHHFIVTLSASQKIYFFTSKLIISVCMYIKLILN